MMTIYNPTNSNINVSVDGMYYSIAPYQNFTVPDHIDLPLGKPKISLKDTTYLHRITEHDIQAKEVISKMLPHFLLEV